MFCRLERLVSVLRKKLSLAESTPTPSKSLLNPLADAQTHPQHGLPPTYNEYPSKPDFSQIEEDAATIGDYPHMPQTADSTAMKQPPEFLKASASPNYLTVPNKLMDSQFDLNSTGRLSLPQDFKSYIMSQTLD